MKAERPNAPSTKRTANGSLLFATVAAVALVALGCRPAESGHPFSPEQKASLTALVATQPEHLAVVPITRVNMLCAQGLTTASQPDVESCLGTIASWATRVKSETQRHQYRFRQNPVEFEHSGGYFKMLMLTVVLAEDFGVHYSPERKAQPGEARESDGFFAKPADVFLHGLLGPERQGTCSSMPVLYVAIGRELGYPLKLVTTKGHMFVRWEGASERFNIEATSRGLSRFKDDYYRHWPFEVRREEEEAEGYLKSLTPSEELAAFLSIRGMCLREAARLPEAAEAFAAAARLAPACQGYRTMLASLQNKLNRTNTPSKSLAIKL